MKLARRIEEIPFDKNSVVTIGTFDGVHLAHQKIIREVVTRARDHHYRSIVITFEPHPREIILSTNGDIKFLTTIEERQDICDQFGVDIFAVLNFDLAFSEQSFSDFYKKYIINGTGISMVVEGYDHHWGRNREGNIKALVQLGNEYGFEVVNVEPLLYNGTPVNSSIIRNELNMGSVEQAASLLGRPYALCGKVVAGDLRGHLLGYPTANMKIDSPKKLVPKDGIYFVNVRIEDQLYFGMASIGVRPTFLSDGKQTIEVNILDFNRNIYGCDFKVEFLRRLRDELKFDSADQLIQQMHKDEELSRKLQYDYQSVKKN